MSQEDHRELAEDEKKSDFNFGEVMEKEVASKKEPAQESFTIRCVPKKPRRTCGFVRGGY